ncbi:MAG: DUF4143 domain-containing protein [Nevskia sp.]|nr:DUF4143 domain-containing protein [Nevskia sp.]
MEVVTLLPLSRAETNATKPTFLKRAFEGKMVKAHENLTGAELVHAVLSGGYPEMLHRRQPGRQQAWARAYIDAIVQRDVRDVAGIEKLDQIPHLLQALAHHSGQLTNFTQLGGQIGLDDKTTQKYVGVLEQLFVVHRLRPWFRNHLKRLVKTPKLHFLDSGLLAATIGATAERIAKDRSVLGALLETFVFSEVMKQASWLEETCSFYHYRDKDQDEVDIVMEHRDGSLLGIEIKAAATVTAEHFKGLRKLADAGGDDFRFGVVLYDGDKLVPFGERLVAAPISSLWG